LLDGFARKDIAAIKDTQDAEFRSWLRKTSVMMRLSKNWMR
jgi:phage antirepressor YoqD-like protein